MRTRKTSPDRHSLNAESGTSTSPASSLARAKFVDNRTVSQAQQTLQRAAFDLGASQSGVVQLSSGLVPDLNQGQAIPTQLSEGEVHRQLEKIILAQNFVYGTYNSLPGSTMKSDNPALRALISQLQSIKRLFDERQDLAQANTAELDGIPAMISKIQGWIAGSVNSTSDADANDQEDADDMVDAFSYQNASLMAGNQNAQAGDDDW